jgi:hypothetical protein
VLSVTCGVCVGGEFGLVLLDPAVAGLATARDSTTAKAARAPDHAALRGFVRPAGGPAVVCERAGNGVRRDDSIRLTFIAAKLLRQSCRGAACHSQFVRLKHSFRSFQLSFRITRC